MELLIKIVNDYKLYYFCKKIDLSCVTGSEFTSDYNKSIVFYEQQKGYIRASWNGNSYYPAEILPVQN